MEIKWLIADIVYIGFILVVFSLLPASMISGQASLTGDELKEGVGVQPDDVSVLTSFGDILKVFFFTVAVDGFPVFLSLPIMLVNWVCVIIPVVFVYDKVRGIS